MNNYVKNFIKQLIPKRYQVQIKFIINEIFSKNELEMHYLKDLINQGSFSIDIGGHRGVYSFLLNKLSNKLVIFEPNIDCFGILSAWSVNNKNVSVKNVALSNQTGNSYLSIPIDRRGVSHDASGKITKQPEKNKYVQKVNIDKLDNYKFKNVHFIKIDVEGHEYNVLEGAENTIKESMPSLLIEIEQRHIKYNINKVFDKLINLNYEGFFLIKKQLTPLSLFNIKVHQSFFNFNKKNKIYVNNFFFLNKKRINKGQYNKFFMKLTS